MPYIPPDQRAKLDSKIAAIVQTIVDDELVAKENPDGKVNYVVSRILCGILNPGRKWTYFNIVRVMGCLICVAFEFYRRIAAKKEDEAVLKNGDLPEYR